ncbi:MAG: sigma 54-interacting transcriptional regulator [Candidatus Eisenbacteria bacterium]|uniref:Sigma 54-interacting transcriptional regulator n=1 Tax=Eiseniibacteriota bacterium TaxID=2212470 RepID=A0A849SIZ7_UNCEI|nr:sigma 54-interacting transcriptional regulator [Candidatus Eisenbacteria bacterium]
MMPATIKSFDHAARAHIASLFRTCPPETFLAELETHTPESRAERVTFQKYRGWALYDAGQYARSRPHLLRALRWSAPGSDERSLVRGLLGECYLRLGQFNRAERCVRRALSGGCLVDPENFIQAGHLFMLARAQCRLGHLTHALETYHRARSLVDSSSPHWTSLVSGAAQVHLHLGELREADALIAECRKSLDLHAGKHQSWVNASIECPLALALGDIERADRVVEDAMRAFNDRSGERIRFLLAESRASVLNARGRYAESERLLRDILSHAVLGGRNSDAVASASRILTECLMGQGRYAEALETSRVAVRAGSVDDRLEWVIALRLMGECQSALGAEDEAQKTFREASSLHASTQFAAERARFEASLRRSGLDARAGANPRLHLPGPGERFGAHRLTLASGRSFVSCDTPLVEAIRATSLTDLPVLIEGETGTGKELVAHLIHELGPHSRGRLVVVDCTSLPESLADVELFGATRGAYTGAHQERAGLLAQADGGTLLLDELPELSRALQAKLLRVIQEGAYRRVGEDRSRSVKTRFVATTNQSLQDLLDSGALKPDLFYRLSGHRLCIRPLRTRREEIGPLAAEITKRAGLGGVMPDAVEWLEAQDWPGNVRQLEMVLRLASATCGLGAMLQRTHLEPHLAPGRWRAESPAGSSEPHHAMTLRARRAVVERVALEQALADSGGVLTRAARSLGISRQAFYKAVRRTGASYQGNPSRVP